MSTLPLVHTSCKDCCFAEFKDNVQFGCSAERLEIYKEQQSVTKVELLPSHYIINNRLCNMQRSKSWADEQIDDPLVAAQIENMERFIEFGFVTTHRNFDYLLDVALEQSINPHYIHAFVVEFEKSVEYYVKRLEKRAKNARLHCLKDYSFTEILSTYLQYCQSTYFSVYTGPIAPDYIEKLYRRVNSQLLPFSICTGQGIQTFNTSIMKMAQGYGELQNYEEFISKMPCSERSRPFIHESELT